MVDFNKLLKKSKEKDTMAAKKSNKPEAKQAKSEKPEKKALVKRGNTALARPIDYEAEMAALAKEASESEELPAGNFASLKGGLMIGGNRMEDDKADVIVAGYINENTFYAGKYDPDEKNPPTCYAFGSGKEEDMRPAENALGYWDRDAEDFVKPESCAECPMNEWGSADTGKGKACQNRRRLAFFSANGVEEDGAEEYIANADLVQLKLPVTSVKGWKGYVHGVANQGLHPSFVVTTLERLEDDDMYKLNFTVGPALAPELLPALKAKREAAMKLLPAPYPDVDAEEMKATLTTPKKKAKGKPGKGRF